MAYFEDLTPYVYFPEKEPRPLNVGWLDQGHAYATGDVPNNFPDLLKALPLSKDTRGWHVCPFCVSTGRALRPSGSAEVRVRGTDGVVYAAPQLIVHYVEVHDYRPPQQFVDAVLKGEAVR